jgi:hypothetical protein
MTWKNIRQAMQLHCENFFNAIQRWGSCGDPLLLKNRLELLITIRDLFENQVYSSEEINFLIESTRESEKVPVNLINKS